MAPICSTIFLTRTRSHSILLIHFFSSFFLGSAVVAVLHLPDIWMLVATVLALVLVKASLLVSLVIKESQKPHHLQPQPKLLQHHLQENWTNLICNTVFFSFVFVSYKLRFSTTSIIQSKIQLLIVNIHFIFHEFQDEFFKQSAILAFFVLFWF